MAGSGRRFALAGILMPLLFLAMAGLSHATVFTVTSLSGEPAAPTACGLVDAIAAANGTVNVCGTKSGNDSIVFALTGTIVIDEPLLITDANLTIQGRIDSPVVIDGDGVTQIIDHEDGNLTLNNLTFQNGFADSMFGIVGGAVLANSVDDLTISGCTFRTNFAVLGGAIYGGLGTVTILNSTFADNIADPTSIGGGGAIYNSGSTLDIAFSTFWMNNAPTDSGGALGWQTGFAPTVKNSIFVSVPGAGDSDNCQAPGNVPDTSLVDNGFNISDDETCFTGTTTSLINTPLMLDPTGLENNGGPTQTVLPAGTSPAVDFVPTPCTDNSSNPVLLDQRLFTRPDKNGGVFETFCDAGAVETGSVAPITIVPKSLKLQIARSTTPDTDKVNTTFTFTYNGDDTCDTTGPLSDENALTDGFFLSLYNSTCAALPANGLKLTLSPFVVHTVNKQQYGTLFQMSPPNTLQQSMETVSARMVALATPAGACGSWTLNLQVAGLNTLDTSTVNLPGTAAAPWALVISDMGSGGFSDASECFDISNAIVGNQIPTPGHGVRRGTRR
jgi:hypothetical protein